MPGENSISFKVYVLEENDNVEVRRFEVDQGVVTSYDYIRERLQYVFPRLRGTTFKILWKDSEGDEITISSDEELMIALSEMKSDLCKLLVRYPRSTENLEERVFSIPLKSGCPALEETQESKVCSACQKPIQGLRYKCLECLQYNQCSDCEHKACHPEHLMIRLTQDYPTLVSLLPKGIHILRQHLGQHVQKCVRGARCFAKPGFLYGECPKRDKSKDRNGGHHRRRSKRHSHHERSRERGNTTECPVDRYFLGDLEGIITSFLGMFPQSQTEQAQNQPMDTDGDSSSQEDNAAAPQTNDGPPQPATVSKNTEEEKVDLTQEPEAASSSKSQATIEAVKLLTEMGFQEESKYLANVIERFDGDIVKALNFLMQHHK